MREQTRRQSYLQLESPSCVPSYNDIDVATTEPMHRPESDEWKDYESLADEYQELKDRPPQAPQGSRKHTTSLCCC